MVSAATDKGGGEKKQLNLEYFLGGFMTQAVSALCEKQFSEYFCLLNCLCSNRLLVLFCPPVKKLQYKPCSVSKCLKIAMFYLSKKKDASIACVSL